jgi:hypothetical protein
MERGAGYMAWMKGGAHTLMLDLDLSHFLPTEEVT